MKKHMISSALTALVLLAGGHTATAQDKANKDGFSSDGGLGGTRINAIANLDLGSGHFTEVEWTYLKDEQAYGFKFERPETRADAEPQDAFMYLICSKPGSKLGNFEIQDLRVVMSGGSTMQASKLKRVEAKDRQCVVADNEAKSLIAKKRIPLDFIEVDMDN